ncbi:MAG TPA: glycosyltransferase family 2 protein, partial [Candidatus Binataceae bacterium]
MARITTVIPAFRRPALLKRAIESVLAQTWSDLEVRVFDDASGDNTAPVVEAVARRDSRVRYVCNPRNLGMIPNAAAAIARVDSEFFTVLNDDDFLAPDFFRTAIAAFEKHPDAGAFIGRLVYWDLDIPNRTRAYFSLGREGYLPAPEAFIEILSKSQNHTWTSMMFRREVIDTVGGLDVGVGYAADLDFELQVLARFPAIISETPCAIYCLHGGSSSHDDWLTPCIPSMLRMLGKVMLEKQFDTATRRRMFAAMQTSFRHTLVTGVARALALGHNDAALRAADFLTDWLAEPRLAAAIRFAARESAGARVARAALRSVRKVRAR